MPARTSRHPSALTSRPRHLGISLLALLTLSWAHLNAAAAPPMYRVTALEKPEGFHWMWVADINDRGEVLGLLERPYGDLGQCVFIWRPETGTHLCKTVLPQNSVHVRSLNLYRQASGEQVEGTGRGRPITWSLKDGITHLPELGTGEGDNTAYGINDHGEVAGGSSPGLGRHAIVWLADGTLVDRNPADYDGSQAYGINERGDIAVELVRTEPEFSTKAGVIDYQGQATEFPCLGNVPGDCFARSFALNNRGQVVGDSHYDQDRLEHAFIWSANWGIRQLTAGGPYKRFHSSASDINDRGEVVGAMHGEIDGVSLRGPFRWDATDGTHFLVDLIDPTDPLAGRLQLITSRTPKINRWGFIVVNGYIDGVLEPRTLILSPVR